MSTPPHGGLRGNRRRHGRGGLSVLRRLPDDAVHRGAGAHGPASSSGRRARASTPRASSRPSAWRGAPASTGARAATGSVGQGLSLMQESLSEMCYAQLPMVVLNMSRGQGDYFQAHPRRWARRLPPHRAGTGRRAPKPSSSCSSRSISPTSGAIRCSFYGDYYLAHVQEAVEISHASTSVRCPQKDWAVDGVSSGSGHAQARCRSLAGQGRAPAGRLRRAISRSSASTCDTMAAGIEPMVETGFVDDAELVVVAFGTAAATSASSSASCAPRACRWASSARSRSGPSRARRSPPRPSVRARWRSTSSTTARWSTTSGSRCSAARRFTSSDGSASTSRASASLPTSTSSA